jgi:AraC-like DNA-binding protein
MDLSWDERPSDSPLIERVWYSQSLEAGNFLSVANARSEIVITHYQGHSTLTLRGPETVATEAWCPPYARFIGIQFRPGVFLPDFPAPSLLNRNDVNLPDAGKDRFWLKGAAWDYPDYETADTFADWLARDGLLVQEPLVASILRQQPVGTSLRTAQRRFLRATGLTHTNLFQIERARHATLLLKEGLPILDVVEQAGYFDQPHLTRSLKQFIGLTPAQIQDSERRERLSLLYKTLTGERDMLFTLNAQPGGNRHHEEDRRLGIHLVGRGDRSAGNLALPLHHR